ncbi:MAG TPA: hypothetical protein VFN71_10095 [Methylomirabilota bacterium]|nr:hypothetical protein [Methylomirabilota bacterium]
MSAPARERRAATAILLSLASVPFLLSHVIEDFQLGIAQRVGLSTGAGAALLGLGMAVQMLGLVLAGRGRRAGLVITAVAGAVWTAGGLWDHGPDLLAQGLGFRGSLWSTLAVGGLIVGQGLSCLLALSALSLRSLSLEGRG